MKTSLKALMLGATASLALVACGGDKDDDGATVEASASEMAKGASPLDKPFKLADAEPFDVETYLTAMEGKVEYGSVEFDDSLGATVITDLRPVGEGKDITVGRIELYGINEDAITTLQGGGGFEDMTELFRKIRVYDVSGSLPAEGIMDAEGNRMNGSISIEAMELNAVKVMGGGEGAEMEPGPDNVEFGGMALKGMTFAMPFGGDGEGIDMTVPDLRVMGYANGEFGGFYAKNLAYSIEQTEEMVQEQLGAMGSEASAILQIPILRNMIFPRRQDVKFGEISWDGLTFTNLIPYLKNDETPPVTETDLIRIGGLEMLNQEMKVNGKLAAKVGRTTMDPIDFYHFMPKKVRVVSVDSVGDMTAYVGDENPEIAEILKNNGLDKVKGESEMLYTFDPKSGDVKLDLDGEAQGLYGMSLNFAMADFDYDAIISGAEDGTSQQALMGAALKGLKLEIEDEKLLDTGFAIAGAITEQDPATLRQNVIGILSIGALQGGQFSPRIPQYATALSTFVGEGGTLTIEAAPEEPVTVGGIAAAGQANPAGLLETLNVTVSQN